MLRDKRAESSIVSLYKKLELQHAIEILDSPMGDISAAPSIVSLKCVVGFSTCVGYFSIVKLHISIVSVCLDTVVVVSQTCKNYFPVTTSELNTLHIVMFNPILQCKETFEKMFNQYSNESIN